LEDSEQQVTVLTNEDEKTFVKHQFGISTPNTKFLGLPSEKAKDTISVVMNKEAPATTKRGVLSNLVKVYKPPENLTF
jgi:hypothetical protein